MKQSALILAIIFTSSLKASTHLIMMKGTWSDSAVLAAVEVNQSKIKVLDIVNTPEDECGTNMIGADFDGKNIFLTSHVIWSAKLGVCHYQWNSATKKITKQSTFDQFRDVKGSITTLTDLNSVIYNRFEYGYQCTNYVTKETKSCFEGKSSALKEIKLNGKNYLLTGEYSGQLKLFKVTLDSQEFQFENLISTELKPTFYPDEFFQLGSTSRFIVQDNSGLALIYINPSSLKISFLDFIKTEGGISNISISPNLKDVSIYNRTNVMNYSITNNRFVLNSAFEFPSDSGTSVLTLDQNQIIVIRSNRTNRNYHQQFRFTLLDVKTAGETPTILDETGALDSLMGLKGDDQRILKIFKTFPL